MNGHKARALRRIMGIKKPTASTGGYVWFDVIDWKWYFRQRRNPLMNAYRGIKRRYVRQR